MIKAEHLLRQMRVICYIWNAGGFCREEYYETGTSTGCFEKKENNL